MPRRMEVFMTHFRFVSLCLVTLLCLGLAAPAMASPPCVVPAGLVETINSMIEHILAWFGGGPEIIPSR